MFRIDYHGWYGDTKADRAYNMLAGSILFLEPGTAYFAEPFSSRRLSLKPGSTAVDAGQAVPNLCDDFVGAAPDLGAHELGQPEPHYGPRPPPQGTRE